MRLKPLLAAVAVAAVALAAAPAARANWMTTTGRPPAFGSDVACPSSIEFHYATFSPSAAIWWFHPPQMLQNVQVIDWNPQNGATSTSAPLYQGSLSVPYNPLHIDPADISAPPNVWPYGQGWFTYSANFVLPFSRPVLPGQQVWIRWDDPSGQHPSMYFPVKSCPRIMGG
jgi:hypothetical protein